MRSDCPRPRLVLVAVVVTTGLLAGVIGGLVAQLSRLIEHLAVGFDFSHAADGVAAGAWWRRLAAAGIAGLVCGLVWTRIRPRPRGHLPTARRAAASPSTESIRLSTRKTVTDGLAQLLIVGAGMSLGRETAPRQFATVAAQAIADRARMDEQTRRLVLASAAGAGLASVYNVPLAGAVYALEFIVQPDLRTRRGWGQAAIAVVVSGLSGVVSWLFNRNAAMYRMPAVATDLHSAGLALGWAGATGLAALLVGIPLRDALRWSRDHTTLTRHLWWSIPLAALLVAAIALWQPRIAGNGQVIVQSALDGGLLPLTLLVLCAVKALATLIGFRMGATGGLLTPSLAVGAALGGAMAGWGHAGQGIAATAVVVGAACVLAVVESHPLFAAVFAVELTRARPLTMLAVLVGVLVTWGVARLGPVSRPLVKHPPGASDASSG